MKTFRDLLQETKPSVREVGVEALKSECDRPTGALVLDVREPEEHDAGVVPGAVRLPRGFLELRIEEICADRDREIFVYCAGGVRSVLAARSLQELGYRRVQSVMGGYRAWAGAGHPFEVPVRLTDEQRDRYSRHLKVPEIGEAGQKRLLQARVLLVGAGGLGSPAALYLAAAGVGTLGIADADKVDLSNLQRQVLHTTSRVGRPKVESAAETLRALNPGVTIEPHAVRIGPDNVEGLLSRYDLVVDGCDNFETRYLVNDACILAGKPNVYGSVQRFDGQVSIFLPGKGPCYRCLFPEKPPEGLAPTCDEAGVLGILPGVVGLLQAMEAVKWVIGQGEPLCGRLLLYHALEGRFREFRIPRDPGCAVCGENPAIRSVADSARRIAESGPSCATRGRS